MLLTVKPFQDFIAACAADEYIRDVIISQAKAKPAIGKTFGGGNLLYGDYVLSVYLLELLGVQLSRDCFYGHVDREGGTVEQMDVCSLLFGGDISHVCHEDYLISFSHFGHEALTIDAFFADFVEHFFLMRADKAFCFLDGNPQFLFIYRLEQIGKTIVFEGAEGMFVVCCGEDDWNIIWGKAEGIKTKTVIQLDVGNDEIHVVQILEEVLSLLNA